MVLPNWPEVELWLKEEKATHSQRLLDADPRDPAEVAEYQAIVRFIERQLVAAPAFAAKRRGSS